MDLEDFDNTAPDWDPEGEAEFQSEIHEAREHYVHVGKSKLRQNLEIDLDPKYKAKRVSRKELEVEKDDSEDEEQSVVSFGGHSDVSAEDIGLNDEVDSDAELENAAQDSDSSEESTGKGDLNELLLRKLKKHEKDQQELVSKLSASAKKDAEQGEHVRIQLGIWEGLLEIRIKMQKAIECANVMPPHENYVEYFEVHKSDELETELEDTSRELCGIIDELIDIRKVNSIYVGSCYRSTNGNSSCKP
jgi:protein AATF/BFR2